MIVSVSKIREVDYHTLKERSSGSLTEEPIDEVVPLQTVILGYLRYIEILFAVDDIVLQHFSTAFRCGEV